VDAILKEQAQPLDLDEEEIVGYHDVLEIVLDNYDSIPLSSNVILQFHRDLLKYTNFGFKGKFKDTANIIAEYGPNGNMIRTIFVPLSPFETPHAIQALCEEYKKAVEMYQLDPLIVILSFIHDFLCIHPFKDGNGRMSRLLTLLLLFQNNFSIGKYNSLDHLIEKTSHEYYKALEQSQESWHAGTTPPWPFIKYMLHIILFAYRQFNE
jgi:Fic family protein